MKTFLVYSKKPEKLISTIEDLSNLYFVKYGFSWLYFIDIINILYSIRRKFYVTTALLIAVYLLCNSILLQTFIIFSIGLLAYAMEMWFLSHRKYMLVGVVEAKNSKQAKDIFLQEKILSRKKIFI